MTELPLDWSASLPDYTVSVGWAPDSQFVLGAASSGPISVRNSAGEIRCTWAGHAGGTFRAEFSPEGSRIASVGQDGTAKLWEPELSEPISSVEAGAAWVELLAWAPDGSAFAIGAGRQVSVWTPRGELIRQLGPLPSTATALAWRTDSKVLAAACYGLVQRWDVASGQPDAPLPWKTSLISLAWSPDARWVVAGTQEQAIQIWELPFRPGQELAMTGYPAKVRELAWHFNGRVLATGGGPEIMVWDCGGSGPAGTTPGILEGHQDRVTALTYQTAGHILASGDQLGRVRFWNPRRSTTPLAGLQLRSGITSLAWSRDDSRLALGAEDGTVAVATIRL